jgi:1,4-dihydroxy-6-naphthoate synthase
MDRPLTLAYSPCPNDTYIFAAWTNGLIDDAPAVRVALEDVENLNNSALTGDYELTKVSYGAVPMLLRDYRILRAGGALGEGCGPLLVAREGEGGALAGFADKIIAIPGEMTTAFVLLRLALGKRPQIIQMRFDKIVDAVRSGAVDGGLIIHEARFTYEAAGLVKIVDLGDWWEKQTGMPIPLGAIMIRNDLDDDCAKRVNDAIQRSLHLAREREEAIMPYVREHATDMNEEVMRKHIDTYVTQYSEDVGERGIAAVNELFRRAHEMHAFPDAVQANFV